MKLFNIILLTALSSSVLFVGTAHSEDIILVFSIDGCSPCLSHKKVLTEPRSRDIIKLHKYSFYVLTPAESQRLANAYGVTAYPTTFIVSRVDNGTAKITKQYTGQMNYESFKSFIARAGTTPVSRQR